MHMWKLETVDPSLGSGLVHFAFAGGPAPVHMGTTEIRGLFETSVFHFVALFSIKHADV